MEPRRPETRTDLAVLGEMLGSRIATIEPAEWGDAKATHRIVLADGRAIATRRIGGNDPSATAARIASVMRALARSGLPVPVPTVIESPGTTWLSHAWIEGETAAAWLDEPERALHVADRMGKLATKLGRVDQAVLGLLDEQPDWSARRRDIGRWLAMTTLDLRVRRAVESAVTRVEDAPPMPARFVHGDYAPVNVIVGADGEIRALIDFEHSGLGPALADVAWWGWVVRHHHPNAWATTWPTFLAAAVDTASPDADIAALALIGLVERAAAAEDAESRQRWLDRLSEAASWDPAGDQAT